MDEKSAPIFIKLQEYEDISNIMTVIKKKMHESKETLSKFKQLKAEEDAELENWEQNLDDVHRKVEFINEILTEPKF